jgi:hypothetical protein
VERMIESLDSAQSSAPPRRARWGPGVCQFVLFVQNHRPTEARELLI